MSSYFWVIVVIIVVGSIISSIAKSGDAKRKQQYNKKQTPPPSPPKKREGGDLAKEIKNDSILRTQSPYKERLVEFESEKKHTHPSQKGNVRVERAYVEDSMGEHLSQGCEEHYYERFVAIDDDIKKQSTVNSELAKIIVLGEAINTPRFKKHRR